MSGNSSESSKSANGTESDEDELSDASQISESERVDTEIDKDGDEDIQIVIAVEMSKQAEMIEQEEISEESIGHKKHEASEDEDKVIDEGITIKKNAIFSEDMDIVDYEIPLSAIAPQIHQQEEGQIEVSSGPAFQCLDDLFHAGKLTGEKVSYFKSKYAGFHDALKSSRENEMFLLKEINKSSKKLTDLQGLLSRTTVYPDGEETEMSRLRETLLSYNNNIAVLEERLYNLNFTMECYTNEKNLLEKDVARLPKNGEFEENLQLLHNSCNEIKKEIIQAQAGVKTVQESLEKAREINAVNKIENREVFEKMENLKEERLEKELLPNHIAKEADKFTRRKKEVLKEKKVLDDEYQKLVNNIAELEMKECEFGAERKGLFIEIETLQRSNQEKDNHVDLLIKNFDLCKEKETVLFRDRATLDISLKHTADERRTHYEICIRKTRENDEDLHILKKKEQQLKVAQDKLNQTNFWHERVCSKISALPKDDGVLLKRRQELVKEIEQISKALKQQNNLTSVEHVKLETSAAEEQNLMFQQGDLRIELLEMARLSTIKAEERDHKAQDYILANLRYKQMVEELKAKKVTIQDQRKKYIEKKHGLKSFATFYDVLKNERNKYVTLIQATTQKSAEVKEKIKILQNETEILRTTVIQKDKILQKEKLKRMNSIMIRDSLNNEVVKQQQLEEELRERREQQKLQISKLNMLINQAEDEMVKLRKQYEAAMQSRNERGIQLIERNEELSIFHEKTNLQESLIRKGDVQLQAKEEEIRFMILQKNEQQRLLNLFKKNMPDKRALENEMVAVQIQLYQCQDRLHDLEMILENPDGKNRVRFLKGKDMAPEELQYRVEELKLKLAEKEECLLEKELLYDQVTRLTDRVKKKAEAGKEDTLALAKQVNALQCKITSVTRKMMAQTSEISMHQAQALKLQQEMKEKETMLEHCYVQMEKGEPPCAEFEREWMRMVADEERKIINKMEKLMEEEEEKHYQLAGGTVTTAEPRPNAYIPNDENELPIPRPYGKNAPFKPSELGSTMRHIRKPNPKPIEI